MTPENSNNQEQVKPCPFCGSEARVIEVRHFGYNVKCRRCGLGTGTYGKPATPIELWNNRIDGHGPQANRLSDDDIDDMANKMHLSCTYGIEYIRGLIHGLRYYRDNHTGPQAAGQWIPVSERLPTGTDDVWACHAGSKITEKVPAHYVEMSGRTHWQEIKPPTPPEQTSEQPNDE